MHRKKIKALIGWLLFSTRLHRLLLGDRCVIVAFHRVCDEAEQSPINCVPKEFERYCKFLQRHFNVISLSEFLERLKSGRRLAGTAVITFDDGYKDNAEIAAPILKRMNLPATFFVTTNFIGSETQTFWDEDHGVESKWMSWDDIESLNAQEFDIGCHTENHVDLGKADVELAQAEIENCKTTLERELKTKAPHFAYPFGGKDNIRKETLELVKSAGFACCVSCHGGLAERGSDQFSLPREPITTWHASPFHFGFELLQRT